MRTPLRQRLLLRREPALPPLVPLCWYEQRTHEKIDEDLVNYPEMCEPDIGRPRITARITRIIQADTLPSITPDAETIADAKWWCYSDETVKTAIGIDANATMPMLVEV